MWADARSAAIMTVTPLPSVLTNACTATLATLIPLASVCANAGAAAVAAQWLLPSVLADAGAAAVAALIPPASVLTLLSNAPLDAQRHWWGRHVIHGWSFTWPEKKDAGEICNLTSHDGTMSHAKPHFHANHRF